MEELTPLADGKGETVADARRARRDAEKRKAFEDVKGPAAIYVVPPLSQEMFLPYDLPKRGVLGGAMEVYACPDQQVAGSLLVFALKAPLKIGGADIGDLRTKDGKVFDKENIDVQIVKRWFRAGGAWLTYHGDPRQRNLTPDLLMHDDAAIKVDELAARNYIRCDYPEGSRYIDVSDPDKYNENWSGRIPFHDADTLQPLTIGEWGRNQQFMVTFTVPKDMVYADPSQNLYIDLKAGRQRLNGQQSMWLMRYRSGYAMADLQRVQVQREFVAEAMTQWTSPAGLFRVPGALRLILPVEEES